MVACMVVEASQVVGLFTFAVYDQPLSNSKQFPGILNAFEYWYNDTFSFWHAVALIGCNQTDIESLAANGAGASVIVVTPSTDRAETAKYLDMLADDTFISVARVGVQRCGSRREGEQLWMRFIPDGRREDSMVNESNQTAQLDFGSTRRFPAELRLFGHHFEGFPFWWGLASLTVPDDEIGRVANHPVAVSLADGRTARARLTASMSKGHTMTLGLIGETPLRGAP
jgi:hypothetical protein